MDNSTLQLHATWLRLFKGALRAYEKWLERQTEATETENLKRLKGTYKAPVDTPTKPA